LFKKIDEVKEIGFTNGCMQSVMISITKLILRWIDVLKKIFFETNKKTKTD